MDPAELQPGHRLDRYELLCPLAYGGMATIWLARFTGQLGFERLVVIKMILPQHADDPRFRAMFLDEAKIASRIEHPNVARILDVGEQEGNYFLVLEWIDGDSLAKIARTADAAGQAVPLGIVLRVLADACAGLHAAHELRGSDGESLGVIHRDVSPQNLLVSNAGATTLIDFGVAKARDRAAQDTASGQLKGKVRYMAPEQATGRELDRRADLWSVGAMLYELVARRPPFEGANEVATLKKLITGEAPAPLPPGVPRPIRTILDRTLRQSRDERFATALDLGGALEEAAVTIDAVTSPATVAAFTQTLLADRKAARKRAVDRALEASRARQTGTVLALHTATPFFSIVPTALAGSLPLSVTPEGGVEIAPGDAFPSFGRERPKTSGDGEPPFDPFAGAAPLFAATNAVPPEAGAAQVTAPLVLGPPVAGPTATATEIPTLPPPPHFGPHLAESPSGASATLGSAAVEFRTTQPPIERRRLVTAGVIGLVLAAGAMTAVLVIGSAVERHDSAARGSGSPATTIAQPSATPPPLPPGTPPGAAAPSTGAPTDPTASAAAGAQTAAAGNSLAPPPASPAATEPDAGAAAAPSGRGGVDPRQRRRR